MPETISQEEINFRQEILTRFFKYIESTESFYVIGGASMGKTRLLDFLSNDQIQKHYLGVKSSHIRLIRVDMNRLSIKNESWTFFELLLSSIALELTKREEDRNIREELVELDAQVIQGRDPLLALRFFEMAVSRLCQGLDFRLCFMLDEFDETYKTLSRETFSQLRAVRDANKPYISYAVFLRTTPEQLRTTRDNESFYELISRNMLALGPYSRPDSLYIIQNLERRRNHSLTPALRERLYEASGGHIGLVQAFYGLLIENTEAGKIIGNPGWIEWFSQQQDSIEECRKIWEGLAPDEQEGLSAFAKGNQSQNSDPITKLLSAKGLIQTSNGSPCLFSPVFDLYVRNLK